MSGLELTPLRTIDQINKEHEEIGANLMKGLNKPYQPRKLEMPAPGGTSGFTSFQGKDGYSYTTNYTYTKGEDGKFVFDSEVTVFDPETKTYIDPKTLPSPNPDLAKAYKEADKKKAELSAGPAQLSVTAEKKAKAREVATSDADKASKSEGMWSGVADKAKTPKAEYTARKEAKGFADKEVAARKTAAATSEDEVKARERAFKLASGESKANPKDMKLKKKAEDAERALGTAKAEQMKAKVSLSYAMDKAKIDGEKLEEAKKKVGAQTLPTPKKTAPKVPEKKPATSTGEAKVA